MYVSPSQIVSSAPAIAVAAGVIVKIISSETSPQGVFYAIGIHSGMVARSHGHEWIYHSYCDKITDNNEFIPEYLKIVL